MVYWGLALLPALLHPAIFFGYRRTLRSKRAELRVLIGEDAEPLYKSAFKRDPDYLFLQLYGILSYLIPLGVTFLSVVIATIVVLAHAGLLPPGIPGEVSERIAAIPASALAGIVGAFIFGLYDSLQRAQLASLTPTALHFAWFRLLLGASLAPLVVEALSEGFQSPVAFFVAALPIPDLIAYANKAASNRLGLDHTSRLSEPPTLHHLQGLTAKTIDSLASAGVDSTQHLAHADPVSLLLRTNLSWKVILDLIDQALLFNYVGDAIQVFRGSGIRGSVELAAVGKSLMSHNPIIQEEADNVVEVLASRTNTNKACIENAIRTVIDDWQVKLIAKLWGTEFGNSAPSEQLISVR